MFGFLAFGLYALNLAMGAGGGRRRRQVQGEVEDQCSDHNSPGLVDGVMALTTMFRGFLELLNESTGNHTY